MAGTFSFLGVGSLCDLGAVPFAPVEARGGDLSVDGLDKIPGLLSDPTTFPSSPALRARPLVAANGVLLGEISQGRSRAESFGEFPAPCRA